MNRTIAIGVSASLLLGGCAPAAGTNEQDGTQVETLATEAAAEETSVRSTLAKIDDTKWCYDEADDVYYQLGIAYCATPADADYEQLAIIVPGAYMQATANGDGTFTCAIDASAEVGGYTAATAPVNGMSPGSDGAEAGIIGASTDFTAIDQIQRKESSAGVKISGTFETAQDYIDALNADGTWVNYDATTGTATITSIANFSAAVKTASKGIAAFDQLDASRGDTAVNTEPRAGAEKLRRVGRLQLRLGPGPHHGRAERRRHQ